MLGGSGTRVLVDQLFNVLLITVALLFLSVIMMRDPKEKAKQFNAANDNNILITMRWPTDNDIDLWLRLPDGRRVGYSSRDKPPAHLDVDVVSWRRYRDETGEEHAIVPNEEIITIRDVYEGEYTVNVHYFNSGSLKAGDPVEVQITVQDVRAGVIIFTGSKMISTPREETHFVKFSVRKTPNAGAGYIVEDVYTDRPAFFLPKPQQMPTPFGG